MNKLVTIKQAKTLKSIGFKELCANYAWFFYDEPKLCYGSALANWNHHENAISVPDVDQVIDWLRRKYNIHVYNHAAPFVDPTHDNKVCYTLDVKKCNPHWGWNQREPLGKAKSHNIYACKRMCITIALRWILSQKSEKSKNNKKLSKHGSKSKSD